MSGSSFTNSVEVITKKKLLDQELQATPPTSQSGNPFPHVDVIGLPVITEFKSDILPNRLLDLTSNPPPSPCQSALLTLSMLKVHCDTGYSVLQLSYWPQHVSSVD